MKPHWDKLMEAYADNEKIGVFDVDCTSSGGKDLCAEVGVQGYPTIKYGDPNALEDYEGGREYDDLEKFASELKPLCSPSNLDLCDEDKKAEIEKYLAMDDKALRKEIRKGEKKIKKAESRFKKDVEKLQARYQELQNKKDATIKKIKASGLGLKKSVRAYKKKQDL